MRETVAAGELAGPVRGAERSVWLDALRGVSILAILAVNVVHFRGPQNWWPTLGAPLGPGGRVLEFLILFLASGKFVSTLALLFGIGFAMQDDRTRKTGRSPRRLLARRMAALAGFGALHAVLIWSGDILLLYALAGLGLLVFIHRRVVTLVVWAVVLILLSLFDFLPMMLAEPGAVAEYYRGLGEGASRAYGSGSYGEMLVQRLREIAFWDGRNLVHTLPSALGMMLLGVAAMRAGWVSTLSDHRAGIRRVVFFGFLVGLPLCFLDALSWSVNLGALDTVGAFGYYLGPPVLALGYSGLGALVLPRFSNSGFVRRLAAVGRMALTNYLLQSVVMTLIFYGLGLYGRLGLVAAFALCAVPWAVNLILSPLWLSRFEQGPAEKLWRRLTYGRSDARKPR